MPQTSSYGSLSKSPLPYHPPSQNHSLTKYTYYLSSLSGRQYSRHPPSVPVPVPVPVPAVRKPGVNNMNHGPNTRLPDDQDIHARQKDQNGQTSMTQAQVVDDEKSRTHKLILLQSPLWILSVLYVMQTGILRSWSNWEYMTFSLAVAAPSLLIPALFQGSNINSTRKIPYYLKLNLWVFILVIFGTHFGTHYFFDLMGMEYTFGERCTWHLESDVLGQHGPGDGTPRQVVPLFMYPLTHAYFMSYFCLLVVLEETLQSWLTVLKTTKLGRLVLLVGLSYGLAFAETYVMASPLLEDLFRYRSRERMLKVGSLGYAAYFVVGLPIVKRIDRQGDWGIDRVVIEALGTSMGIMVLLEVWSKVVGPI